MPIWNPIANRIIPQAIADTSATQKLALGTVIQAEHPTYGAGEFIYLPGAANTAIGSWVQYLPDSFATALLAAGLRGSVAVAMSANVASQYGWYQIKGKAIGKALAAFADNGLVYATATAGSVDDAAVAGDLVSNALGASALDVPGTGLAEFELDRPALLGDTPLTAPVAGLAAGYKVARGQHTTVAASDTLVTGLATVVAIVTQLDDDPVVGAMHVTGSIGDQAGAPAAGSALIKTWKSTDATATLIAATTFGKKVNWVAIGT